jgi:lipoyl-dependent peroxiredoxin
MSTFTNSAEIVWQGGAQGSGELKAVTGTFNFLIAQSAPPGHHQTNPEELLAGSQAACYTITLAALLTRRQAKVTELRTTVDIVADRAENGAVTIRESRLTTVAAGLSGMTAEDFQAAAERAEQRCPVSQAISGKVKLTLDARVE